MDVTINFRGKPIQKNLAYNCADFFHFLHAKPVSSGKITGGTGWEDISSYVRLGIINSIKTAIGSCRATISTWLRYDIYNIVGCKVARINSLVRLSKKTRPSFARFTIPLFPCSGAKLLFWRKIFPSFLSPISPPSPFAVAFAALISEPKRSGAIPNKYLWSSWKGFFTPIASSFHVGTILSPHAEVKGEMK